ncbi:predicted protein [Histoplasma capsulatum G186AR]|uniref:Uncharacterized protein n=1 Tax=Ajellomyces capsulatus (strain G186AR / H82 / ATCC MYA-2454 / RMSCC 2432) TaxID=447093 RepID=C0NK85_AJECG|nr:uncharacterized protein HCBG_03565 [Histoplasma capsulatum G186AR]EEH08276.1 predicted protein [Histoplasma capsulatum G186AR]
MRDALERLERMERIRGAGRCRYNCADTGVQYVVRVVRGQRGDEMIMSRERTPIARDSDDMMMHIGRMGKMQGWRGGMGINAVITVDENSLSCFLAAIPATIKWICFESSRRALAYIPMAISPMPESIYV